MILKLIKKKKTSKIFYSYLSPGLKEGIDFYERGNSELLGLNELFFH